VLATFATVVVLVLALVWLVQRRLIYFPDPSTPRLPADAREAVFMTSDGLRLSAWLVPPTGPDRRVAVLVMHGNAGHRGDRIGLARAWAAAGLTVLLLDYRGYGGNPGSPSEAGLARDARAGLAYLNGIGLPQDATVYFGESLGAAVATELATECPPKGLVLRSPFTELADVAAHHYPALPVRWLLRDRFRVVDHITRVTTPTIVIYGSADTTVPPAQSRLVADHAALATRVVVVDRADHNYPALSGKPVIDAVLSLA
jgi:fermentation-respiration switch protein FrsA (DUF1100 family)